MIKLNPIIEVNGLIKTYPKSDFKLDNVSFSVPSGAIMGFIGENGAGKTSTLKCIIGTLIKDSGQVKLFGEDQTDKNSYLRDNLGIVFDTESFGGGMTPRRVASIMRSFYSKWDDDVFIKHLENFKLSYTKKIKTFSRGMTMKLALAAALSHDPRLLILDEATGGLDPVARDEVLDVLLDFVQDENKSVLLSSHITSDLEKVADYITFIHEGKIILSEPKDDLIYSYGIMRCTKSQYEQIEDHDIIAVRNRGHQVNVLVESKDVVKRKYKNFVVDDISIEEMMLMFIRGEENEKK